MLRPGYRLDRYELLAPIASGGMASVWLARLRGKRGFEKLFAIKTIRTELVGDPRFQEMFLDEARIASGIQHPNVAQILDLGEQEDVLYLVMEWVGGESLDKIRHLVAKRRELLPIGVTLRVLADACAGLHAAHELRDDAGESLGIVHRDVSPQEHPRVDGRRREGDRLRHRQGAAPPPGRDRHRHRQGQDPLHGARAGEEGAADRPPHRHLGARRLPPRARVGQAPVRRGRRRRGDPQAHVERGDADDRGPRAPRPARARPLPRPAARLALSHRDRDAARARGRDERARRGQDERRRRRVPPHRVPRARAEAEERSWLARWRAVLVEPRARRHAGPRPRRRRPSRPPSSATPRRSRGRGPASPPAARVSSRPRPPSRRSDSDAPAIALTRRKVHPTPPLAFPSTNTSIALDRDSVPPRRSRSWLWAVLLLGGAGAVAFFRFPNETHRVLGAIGLAQLAPPVATAAAPPASAAVSAPPSVSASPSASPSASASASAPASATASARGSAVAAPPRRPASAPSAPRPGSPPPRVGSSPAEPPPASSYSIYKTRLPPPAASASSAPLPGPGDYLH